MVGVRLNVAAAHWYPSRHRCTLSYYNKISPSTIRVHVVNNWTSRESVLSCRIIKYYRYKVYYTIYINYNFNLDGWKVAQTALIILVRIIAGKISATITRIAVDGLLQMMIIILYIFIMIFIRDELVNGACFLKGPVTMFCVQSPEATSSACGVFTTEIKISAKQTRFVVILRKLFFSKCPIRTNTQYIYICVFICCIHRKQEVYSGTPGYHRFHPYIMCTRVLQSIKKTLEF